MEIVDTPHDPEMRRRLTTIVAADICDYSSFSETNEIVAIKVTDILFALFQKVTKKHDGRVFKRIADGFLAEYPSAHAGVRAAIEFRKEVKARNNISPTSMNVAIRTGIHVGDVIDRPDGDLLGHGVNIAVRLQEQAERNGILGSLNIINLLGSSDEFAKHRRGALSLKNISEPVVAFEIDVLGRDRNKVKHILKSAKKYLLWTGAVFAIFFLGIAASRFNNNDAISRLEVDKIIMSYFQPETGSVPSSFVSTEYIRNVLENLNRSNIPSSQASFALIQTGNITQAIEMLASSLDTMPFGEEDYVMTLHQIAALSYHYDTKKSVAYYESILEIDPTDKVALLWLVRTYNLMGNATKSLEMYDTIISKQIGTPEEKLELQIDMAFSLILQGEFQIAVDILHRIKDRVKALPDPRIVITWQTNLSIAYERLNRITEAEAVLISVIAELKRIGADSNMPRAYNVLGQISEKKAALVPERKAQYFQNAITYYELQYQSGLDIDKKHEQSEALHYLGQAQLEIGLLDDARRNFLKGLRLAREHDHLNAEFMSRLGLAQIAYKRGNTKEACQHVDKAEKFYKTRMDIALGPKTRGILKSLGCQFQPEGP